MSRPFVPETGVCRPTVPGTLEPVPGVFEGRDKRKTPVVAWGWVRSPPDHSSRLYYLNPDGPCVIPDTIVGKGAQESSPDLILVSSPDLRPSPESLPGRRGGAHRY